MWHVQHASKSLSMQQIAMTRRPQGTMSEGARPAFWGLLLCPSGMLDCRLQPRQVQSKPTVVGNHPALPNEGRLSEFSGILKSSKIHCDILTTWPKSGKLLNLWAHRFLSSADTSRALHGEALIVILLWLPSSLPHNRCFIHCCGTCTLLGT